MTQLSLEEIKDLILFCKANQVHQIRVGELEAHLSPDVPVRPVGSNVEDSITLPRWVTGD